MSICSRVNQLIKPLASLNITRGYALRSDLKIKWIKPEKISCIKPERSGDMSALPMVDPKTFMLQFQKNQELQKADEKLKKLFTIENNPRRERINIVVQDTIDRVKRHDLDYGSIESKIAKMTVKIRSLQEVMEKHPRNKRLKVVLKEKIDKRKRFLRYLRRWDYPKYEWLLEKLDIVFKQYPEGYLRVERKRSLRHLTDAHCEEIKQKRLEEYRRKLEAQQLDFLEKKYKNLEFIRNEQIACKVKVTVSEQDVKEAKARYEELLEKRRKEEKDLQAEAS